MPVTYLDAAPKRRITYLDEEPQRPEEKPSGFGLEKATEIGRPKPLSIKTILKGTPLRLPFLNWPVTPPLNPLVLATQAAGAAMEKARHPSRPYLSLFKGEIARSAYPGAVESPPMEEFVKSLATGEIVGRGLIGGAIGAVGLLSGQRALRSIKAATIRPILPKTPAELLNLPEEAALKLPAPFRSFYLSQKQRQAQGALGQLTTAQQEQAAAESIAFQQTVHEAKQQISRLHQETMAGIKADRLSTEATLQQQAQQRLLTFKHTEAKPLLRAQSDRYAQGTNLAIEEAPHVSLEPQFLLDEIVTDFDDDPAGLRLALGRLRLDVIPGDPTQLANKGQFFSPREVLSEIDRIGQTVKRSPTEVYTHADSVADRLRGVLLTAMEKKGVNSALIRAQKSEWAAWKPTQKRLVRDLRLFEQSEWVSDQAVTNLVRYAKGTSSENTRNYFQSVEKYLGKPLDKTLRTSVQSLDQLERRQLAVESAKLAEAERLYVMEKVGEAEMAQRQQTLSRGVSSAKSTSAQHFDLFKFREILEEATQQRRRQFRTAVLKLAGLGAGGVVMKTAIDLLRGRR